MRTTKSFPKLKGLSVLGPMAGVNDIAFRLLCKKYGAALTYTELLSSAALSRNKIRNLNNIGTATQFTNNKFYYSDKKEHPISVQLFGSNLNEIIEAAKNVEEYFDIIDINCGCPAHKVVKTGAGSELMKNPELIGKIVEKLASSVSKPVTIKIRTGASPRIVNAVHVAKLAEDAGAAAIAVHGRTQNQGYGTPADWQTIKEVKDAVNIPVIGNGDVFTPEIFRQRLKQSGVDYIMIAREAGRNPYIFKQVNDYMKKRKYSQRSKIKIIFDYMKIAKKQKTNFKTIKKHAIHFTKGLEGGAHLRVKLAKCKTVEELKELLKN